LNIFALEYRLDSPHPREKRRNRVEHFSMASSRILFLDWLRPQDQPYSGYRYVLQLVVVFALYLGAGKLGLAVPFTNANVSPVWPAAGIGVAAVLIWGFQIAPAIAFAAFFVNFLSPIPPSAAVAIGLGNASSAVLAAYLLRRFGGSQISLPRLRDVLKFVILAAVLATTIAASVGVTALTLTHTKAWAGYGSAWRIWWLGDAMGVLLVAPLFLTAQDLLRVCRGWRLLEAFLLSIAILVTSAVVFGPWTAVRDDVLAFVVFPFVIWAAIRFRIGGVAVACLLSASLAVWGTANGFGPFVNHTLLHNAVLLQVFIAVTTLTGLILAAVINEREYIGEAFESEKKLLSESEAAKERLAERVRERTRELEQKTAQLEYQAKLLDLANDAIFVRTADDKISYWNEGAERLYGWASGEVLGRSIHEVFRTEFPVPLSEILQSDRWEGELRHTTKDGSQISVASRWTTLRDHNGKPVGWLEINTDITARNRAEEAMRSLSGRILTLQDDERRRIARGLHDSLGQYLTALRMNLDILQDSQDSKAKLAADCSEIVDKCLTETRTISHLLHPPLLDEAGFSSAARWYVDGFAQRSSIKVNLNLPPELGRLHRDMEIALFRGLQEALTNVHRHSGASAVDICLSLDAKQIRLEIRDNGKGIPAKRLKSLIEGAREAGVGIAGMRERMRELGGSVEIQSDRKGTKVIVRIPILEKAATDSKENGQSGRSVSAA
jgi:PAS domain S-box-containing protein